MALFKQKYQIKTRKTPAEAAFVLQQNTSALPPKASETKAQRLFAGDISQKYFSIQPARAKRSRFAPLISGEIQAAEGQTQIEMQFEMQKRLQLVCMILGVCALLSIFWLLLSSRSGVAMFVIPVVFLVFFNVALLAFKRESVQAMQELQSLLI